MKVEQIFIELSRRFRVLEEVVKAEDLAFASYTAILSGRQSSMNWDELLVKPRVVILGEAGSGKSWELEERVNILSRQGKFAFFIRLDQLVARELRKLWDEETWQKFIRWKQGTEPAYFFLDSVDEAKFLKLSDFHATLESFQHEIGSNTLGRVKIFLSSRISEWQQHSDGFKFRQLFPLPPTDIRVGTDQSKQQESPKEIPLVVHLEPLTRDQVETLARGKQISNVHSFVKALDDAYAWEFARRPLDVSDLIAFWKANGRIGSLTELIEFDISSKLRSRSDRAELPLSPVKTRDGAEWLAAASVLCRKFSFFVPEDNLLDADSLNPFASLPADWSESESRALFNRSIFDAAVYGRFRFHHRRVCEYLAAKWIGARMNHGCPPEALEDLLIQDVRGKRVLRPTLRPAAAWLCLGYERWNEFVRDLVLKTDPWLHLRYGDPASLSIDYRRRILDELTLLSKDRGRMSIESSSECLAKIANDALSDAIAKHISNTQLSQDLRVEFLDIVRHGKLLSCAESAFEVISSPGESEMLKSHAALAIGAMEDIKLHERLFQTVIQLPSIPNHLCTSVVQSLYPKSISPDALVQLMAKTQAVREFGVDLPYFLKAHFESVVTTRDAGVLLEKFVKLAQTPPLILHGQETLPLSRKYWWVGKFIPTILQILFQKPKLPAQDVEVAVDALSLLSHVRKLRDVDREEMGELSKLIESSPTIRQLYVWRILDKFRREHKKEPTHFLQIFDPWEVVRLLPQDFSWLLEDVRGRPTVNDRLFALRLAIEAWDASGRKFANRWRLRQAVKHDAALEAEYRQSILTGPLFPVKRFWHQHIRYQYGRWWWQRKFESAKSRWGWIRDQIRLFTKLKWIASGEPVKWLEMLSREADDKHSDHWAPNSWSGLEKKRGQRITRAAKAGCIAFWRSYTPPLPHEKPERNRTAIEMLVGLTGLQTEFQENPSAISRLTENEAKLAARYATNELNDFPAWFQTLAAVHEKAASEVLCECIEAEWKFPAEHSDVYEMLARLAWRGEAVIYLVQDNLLSLLNAGDPANYSILQFTLSALMHQENPPSDYLLRMAGERAHESNEIGKTVLWLTVWMQIDGKEAVDALQSILPGSSNADEIVVRLSSALSGENMERGPLVKNPSYFSVACLRNFIPIVYRHVKLSDDVDRRHGGAYTPTARDHAQRFRGVLLDNLAKIEGIDATDALRELADEPTLSSVRDWILDLIAKRLEIEADFTPWKQNDLRTFAESYETDPKNDKELFAIARRRLQVIKWAVEESDNSLRDDLREGDVERLLRRWLQRNLNDSSQKRYNVPQEEEIDQQQRPDLRVVNPKTAPVSIEVKWADYWTLQELLDGLETQLVGKYLRAHNSQYGIYAMGHNGKKQHWIDSTTNNKLDFEQVVEIIRQRAIVLMKTNPKIGGLEVFGIDFRDPSKKQS